MHKKRKNDKFFSYNFLLLLVLLLTLFLGSYYVINSKKFTDVGIANTISNLNNGAYMVEYNDWIYYSNASDKNHLYKMKLDGTKSKKIVSTSVKNLCISDGYIYFIDTNRYNVVYRCNTNGNKVKKIISSSCKEFNISEQYIYYINMNKDDDLYRCSLNGSDSVLVNNISQLSTSCIVDNYLYSPYKKKGNTLHKINLLNGDIQKLNDTISWTCTVVDNWLYFIDLIDSYTLYKINLDGSNLTKLSAANCISYNIINDTIYYQSEEKNKEGLYSCDLDGANTQLICTGYYSNLTSISTSLYFNEFNCPDNMIRINLYD